MPLNLDFSCDLLLLGRGLTEHTQPDGSRTYTPSAATVHCAHEAGRFWQTHATHIRRIISSGGYPRLAQGMHRPADGTNEATIMASLLRQHWAVTCPIDIEPDSEHTFGNLACSIAAGFLQPRTYTADHRLGLVVGSAHAPRVIILTQFGLAINRDGLFRVQPTAPDLDPLVLAKQHRLAKLTQIAVTMTLREGRFPPGSPGCVDRAFQHYAYIYPRQSQYLRRFDTVHGPDWQPDDVLVV